MKSELHAAHKDVRKMHVTGNKKWSKGNSKIDWKIKMKNLDFKFS